MPHDTQTNQASPATTAYREGRDQTISERLTGRCHTLITNHILVPLQADKASEAATVRYEKRV